MKWYAESGIYEASGAASANSMFFENQADHALFLRLWNQFMSHYADKHHYSFTEMPNCLSYILTNYIYNMFSKSVLIDAL